MFIKLKFCSATKNDQNAKNVSIITVCHMGSKLLSHGSKDIFLLTLLKRASRSLNVLTLLWRATRASSVIGFAAGYFLRCLHVRQPDKAFKMLRVGQSVFC